MFGSSADILKSEVDDLKLEEAFICSVSGDYSVNAQCHQSLQDITMENLTDQIRELKDVNARLMRNIQEQDCEINKLRSQLSNRQSSDSFDNDSSSGKIVELAKAKRDLTAKYEAEHVRLQKTTAEKANIEKKLAEAESLLMAASQKSTSSPDKKSMLISARTEATEKQFSSEQSTNALHHRWQSAMEKATLATHENQCLKQQLSKMQRLLERELGQNVDVNQLLREDHPTFKGRDEQIQLLKAKVESVKKELEAFQVFMKETGNTPGSLANTCVGKFRIENDYNMKHKESLAALEQKRREETSVLNQKYEKVLRDFNELKSKSAAEKARNDYLSKENTQLSQFNRHVLATCQKDAELIQYFQTTIKDLRSTLSKTALLCATPDSKITPVSSLPVQDEENSLLEKIAKMEHQLSLLKNINSLSFDKIKTSATSRKNRKGVQSGRKSASSSSSLRRAGSTTASTCTSLRLSNSSRTSLPEKHEDSLSEMEENTATEKASQNSDADLDGHIMSELETFNNVLGICKTVSSQLRTKLEEETAKSSILSEKLALEKENADLLQVQVNHLQIQAKVPPIDLPSKNT